MDIRRWVGIDLGLGGCIAIHNVDTDTIELRDMPTVTITRGKSKRRLHDECLLWEATDLGGLSPNQVFVTVEKAGTRPGQAGRSQLTIGYGAGLIAMAITARKYRWTWVTPHQWKRSMIKASAGQDKEASRRAAMMLFPSEIHNLQRKCDHDRAEALLILEYGRRYVEGGKPCITT